MRIYKFGGASVKDADGVKNIVSVLKKTKGEQNTLVIVSAMGKTTNALEKIIDYYFNSPENLDSSLIELEKFHLAIINTLFNGNQKTSIALEINNLITEMKLFLKQNKSPNYSFVYDQIVSFGELFSTKIIVAYLNFVNLNSTWVDARKYIKTDSYYRGANLDWSKTQEAIKSIPIEENIIVSQGFIGSDENNFTTTLGREGSDYSAAIFGYSIDAESITIWKDVPGVLNGDPRHFENTELLHQISYNEAIELAFYGASVIHPKTLQPLQQKEIPLYVKSFLNPLEAGTSISKGQKTIPLLPCYIVKQNQVLLQLSSLDFSFIVEDNISEIFSLLHKFQMRVDLIQNSAISFSLCIQNKYNKLSLLTKALEDKFKITIFENVDLYTIRRANEDAEQFIKNMNREVLLEQNNQETLQVVLK